MGKLILFIIGCLIACATYGASIDCSKAVTAVDRSICASHDLSALDEDMADAYHDLLKGTPDLRRAIQQQKQWLRDVRDVCQNDACLRAAYQARLDELNREIEQQEVSILPPSFATGSEIFIGSWEGAGTAAHAIYGTMTITRTYLRWRRNSNYNHACRLAFQVEKEGYGVAFQGQAGEKYLTGPNSDFVTYMLKITSDNCNTGLGYVRITFHPKSNSSAFEFIEYDKSKHVQGLMHFTNTRRTPPPETRIRL